MTDKERLDTLRQLLASSTEAWALAKRAYEAAKDSMEAAQRAIDAELDRRNHVQP